MAETSSTVEAAGGSNIGRVIFRNTVFITVGGIALRVLNFLYGVYVVRRLGDHRFGEYNTILAWVCLFAIFAEPGITQYALREIARQLRRMGQPAPAHLLISARRAPHLPEVDGPLHALSAVILQDAELLELFLPTLRADFTVLETYQFSDEPPLECPLTAFGGREDTRVTAESLSAWHIHTGAAFTVEFFDGGHFYLQTQRASLLQSVARALAAHLSR